MRPVALRPWEFVDGRKASVIRTIVADEYPPTTERDPRTLTSIRGGSGGEGDGLVWGGKEWIVLETM